MPVGKNTWPVCGTCKHWSGSKPTGRGECVYYQEFRDGLVRADACVDWVSRTPVVAPNKGGRPTREALQIRRDAVARMVSDGASASDIMAELVLSQTQLAGDLLFLGLTAEVAVRAPAVALSVAQRREFSIAFKARRWTTGQIAARLRVSKDTVRNDIQRAAQ
ncbi:MAG: hypothetical protein ABJL33_15445 [Hyphomicrobiales bacterium]